MELNFIDFEKSKIKYQKDMKRIEVKKLLNEFFSQMAKIKGHKKITTRIELDLHDFFYKKGIKEDYISYVNLDDVVGGEKYYNRELRIKIDDTITYFTITPITNDLNKLAYFDNVLEYNQEYSIENIEKIENTYKTEFENLKANYEKYNQELQELIDLQETFSRYEQK